MLDTLLLRNDSPGTALRTLYDPYNDEELVLSREELRTLLNIQQGRTPEVAVDPYPDHEDWYSNEPDPFPISSAPLPKRRFKPSMWEERKIVKLVRPLRSGHSPSPWSANQAPAFRPLTISMVCQSQSSQQRPSEHAAPV